ncbi:MAG: tyrosine-type recombinase/integrase [Armatimonadota bacterium]|nr:tyrosine-type recombinase/integrase [Armatimonadota bacterium]
MPNPIRLLQPANDLERAIDDFAVRLRAQGRSELTISAYLRDLRCFARALPDVDIRDITPAMIDSALADPALTCSENGAPKSPATMYRLKATLRAFFAWAAESGIVESNPARSITSRRLSRKPPKFLTEAEKRRLLKELRDRTSPVARRDRVIFELFLGTGIRIAELVNLDIDDVDIDGKHIYITGKGGIPQAKFLKSSLRTLLRNYLKERRRLAGPEVTALFISSRGSRLCCRQIAQRLAYWLGKAGIQKNVTPHGLRHTFATHLYAATSDVRLVKEALGHLCIGSTEVYTHLVNNTLEDAIERL